MGLPNVIYEYQEGMAIVQLFPNTAVSGSDYWGGVTEKWAMRWQKASRFIKIE